MKRIHSLVLTAALAAAPLFAQRGNGGGMHGGMGMGHDMGSHQPGAADRDDHGKLKSGSRSDDLGKRSISEQLEHNTRLAAKLRSLLPPGTNLEQAAAGFKNLGQFVAAVHVSHNLGIPFSALKAEMTGKDHDSLGQAIHELRPAINARNESKKAGKQAKRDIDDSEKS